MQRKDGAVGTGVATSRKKALKGVVNVAMLRKVTEKDTGCFH